MASIQERIINQEPSGLPDQYQKFVDSMNFGEYSLSYSSLREFAKSPLHFLRYKTGDKKQTDAMEFGALVHTLILEPEEFNNRYVILSKAVGFEENNWAKKENKIHKEITLIEAERNGKKVVTLDKLLEALEIKESVLSNTFAGELIRNCHTFEKPLSFDFYSKTIKGFVDGISYNYVIDLKKVTDANPQKIKWDIQRSKWHWQAFLYLYGLERFSSDFYNICYDANGGICVIKQSFYSLSMAEAEIKETIDKLDDCLIGENWNYSFEFNTELGYYISDEI